LTLRLREIESCERSVTWAVIIVLNERRIMIKLHSGWDRRTLSRSWRVAVLPYPIVWYIRPKAQLIWVDAIRQATNIMYQQAFVADEVVVIFGNGEIVNDGEALEWGHRLDGNPAAILRFNLLACYQVAGVDPVSCLACATPRVERMHRRGAQSVLLALDSAGRLVGHDDVWMGLFVLHNEVTR
jgi:hypothetical protein